MAGQRRQSDLFVSLVLAGRKWLKPDRQVGRQHTYPVQKRVLVGIVLNNDHIGIVNLVDIYYLPCCLGTRPVPTTDFHGPSSLPFVNGNGEYHSIWLLPAL